MFRSIPVGSSSMIPFPRFLVFYMASLIVAVLVGLALMVGPRGLRLRKMFVSLRHNARYMMILFTLPAVVLMLDFLAPFGYETTSHEMVNTSWILQLGGGAVGALQMRLNYRLLIDMFVFLYVWVFAYITFFSPLLLLAKDDRSTLRKYTIAMAFNYLVLIPFYLFFPVSVSGSVPESGAAPLLYVNTNWGRLVTSIDPLNNGFPSGHVSLLVSTVLVFALSRSNYKAYTVFLVGATAGISLSVLSLGVHWPPDVLAGLAIGILAYAVSRSVKVGETVDWLARSVSRKPLGDSGVQPQVLDANPLQMD